MPFTKANVKGKELSESDLDYIYKNIIKKAVDLYRQKNRKVYSIVERFDAKVGSLVGGIINKLNEADLVIADLTGLNPNVMYELGVRHSLNRGTIVITQNIEELPSDLKNYMAVNYTFSNQTVADEKNFFNFIKELHLAIDQLENTSRYDSPVLEYLEQRTRFRKDDEIARLKENIIIASYLHQLNQDIADLINSILPDQDLTSEVANLLVNNISGFTSALRNLSVPITSSKVYFSLQAAIILTGSIEKSLLFDSALPDFFGTILSAAGQSENPFSYANILNKEFINSFRLEKDGLYYVTIKDVFSKESDLSHFVQNLIEILKGELVLLNVSSKEIEAIIDIG